MGSEEKVMGIPQLLHYNTLAITGSLFIAIIGFKMWKEKIEWGTLPLSLLLLSLALALLVISADFFVKGAKGLANRAGVSELIIGLTIVSIGTSIPEILVSSVSALKSVNDPQAADLAIGGIFGSVLVQITLCLGVVVLFKGMSIRPSWLKRDGITMLLSIFLLSFFVYSGDGLTRIEGLILVTLYLIYIMWLLIHRKEIREDELTGKSIEVDPNSFNWTTTAYISMIALGLFLAVFAAQHLVSTASDLAVSMKIPQSVIGTTVIGLGTSLPELTIALMAVRRSEGVAIGTLIGSNITDPLFSIGIAALINPLSISETPSQLLDYIIPATIIGSSLAIFMMWTQYQFKRWEGIVLVLFYCVFLGILLNSQFEIISV